MHAICETCGTQFDDRPAAPAHCPICEDDRQYVGWEGQRWTTHEAMATRYRNRLEDDGGLLGLGLTPAFAIDQRALLLPTQGGNVLWESLSLVSDEAVAALRARGGVDCIAISHPHFYASMVEWSRALGDVPILLHEADRAWVQRPSPALRWWSGDRLELWPGVRLLRCGGHFPGSTALHWRDARRPRGALFPGDALQVVQDRRHVSFMYSYPNLVPMNAADVRYMRSLLRDCRFDDVYGYTWGRNIRGDGRAAVDASFDRYLAAVAA
ncbi:MBL fold metallo-hydrolase [Agrilutibacter solisilvae]|uniref:MBL fold metallo-hydrolase n=1 Tax=Agrilutibacter solisilvae TaxID=2763317 RepID=A0A974Y2C8_9GAMM|nr:MBL fold metallo-hydrolase [Lysobacter solisilvae]QSX79263.1 MBL fold metallo-hydrolase [Lysobacter solisilvae]